MAELSDKKEYYNAFTDINRALADNADMLDLVEMSDGDELDTLKLVDESFKKAFKGNIRYEA